MEDREHGVILHKPVLLWSKTIASSCTLIALSLSRGSNVGAVEKVSLSNLHVAMHM
jgi:hypothetical protein